MYLLRKTYGLGMRVYARAKAHTGTRSLPQTTILTINSFSLLWMVRNALYAHFNIRTLRFARVKFVDENAQLETLPCYGAIECYRAREVYGNSPFSWKALFIRENGEPAACVIDGQCAVYLHSNSSFKQTDLCQFLSYIIVIEELQNKCHKCFMHNFCNQIVLQINLNV